MKFSLALIFVVLAATVAQGKLSPIEELGKQLFFDKKISGGNSMSCASCHQPKFSWSHQEALVKGETGVRLGRRAPGLFNIGLLELGGSRFFWDGRAANLEVQALGPITNSDEMNQDLFELERELRGDENYRESFARVFSGSSNPITARNVAKALASFERTIVIGETPFSRFLGASYTEEAEKMISASALRGYRMYIGGRVNCAKCHTFRTIPVGEGETTRDVILFTDDDFWDVGLKLNGQYPDMGRFAWLPADKKADPRYEKFKHAFRTPSLWGLSCRSHYMHDGSMSSLREVVEHYNNGGSDEGKLRSSLSRHMRPQGLDSAEIDDLVAFLQSLSPDKCE